MPNAGYPFWLGGVAGSMAAACTHPLDLTKVRMQTLHTPISPLSSTHTANKSPSTLSTIRKTIQTAGLRALYTGLTASLLRQMSYSLVRLGSYEEMKRRWIGSGSGMAGKGMNDEKRRGGLGSVEMWKLLLMASVAGGLGGIAGNPADILLVRMTSDQLKPAASRYNYPNALTGLVHLTRTEGVSGLCRGIVPNTVRAVLMNCSQVASYDFFKTTLLRNKVPFTDFQFRDNTLLHAVASCLAGTVATTVCAPADVIKSRVMSASGTTTPLRVLRDSLREEGPKFLFKGWTPAFIRLGPNTMLMFVFLEHLKKLWRSLEDRR